MPAFLSAVAKQAGMPALDIAARCVGIKVLAHLAEPSISDTKAKGIDLLRKSTEHPVGQVASGDVAIVTMAGSPESAAEEAALVCAASSRYSMTDYAQREHRILGVLGAISGSGFRVDEGRLASHLIGEPSKTLRAVDANLRNGRVHPRFDTFNATGRACTSAPNLQGLGKGERDALVPDEGDVILVADLRQIEPRVVAALSQDPGYLDRFDAGIDVYADMANDLLRDPARREEAKKILNGINYGLGLARIADAAQVTTGDAKAFVIELGIKFPIWASWRERMAQDADVPERWTTVMVASFVPKQHWLTRKRSLV
jgi:hypothetical protein